MRITILKTLFLLFCIVATTGVAQAQFLSRSVTANAAETFTNTSINLSLTYVLGEPIADFLPNTAAANPGNLFLTAGFHQPDVEVQNVLNNNFGSALVLYPNPASGGTVKLAFNHIPDGVYIVNLVDAAGKILQSQTVNYFNNNFLNLSIDVSQLSGGIYFISVVNPINFQGRVKLIKI